MNTPDIVADADKAIVPKQPALNIGLVLREAREGMGLSVHDIANRIKFAPKQVESLEANDFGHLPQATFLRGFVRSYARVLQLDEEQLIAALPVEPSRQVETKAPSVDVAFPSLLKLQRVNMLWLAGALGVALVLGLFVLLQDGEPVAKPAGVVVEPVPLPGADAAVSAVAETGPQAVVVEPVKIAEPQKKSEPAKTVERKKLPEPAKAAEPEKSSEPVKPREAVAPIPEMAAASAPVAAAKSDVPLEVLKRRPLHFVFSEDMWVEVIDVHGSVLLSRNVQRGSEKWIGGPGRAPYDISLSNPGKAKLYYKGKEIDLSGYAATETAHLKVE